MADIQELLREAAGSERTSFGVDDVWQRSRTIRRRKIISLATLASVVVVVLFWIAGTRFDLFQADAPDPARPAPPPRTEPFDEEPATDVFVAEAPDGSWTMFAGVDEAEETLCLSLQGVVCSTTTPRPGFVLMQGFDEIEQEGFVYGTVNQRVDVLELFPADAVDPISLRLRRFPRRLDLDHLRFFVHPLRGSGAATLVARGRNEDVLQETPFTWGTNLASDVFFPTWSSESRPGALVGGTLVEERGCLFLRLDEGDALALWEQGYSYAYGAVRDETGEVVAQVGDPVQGGGGYYSELAYVEDLVGQPIPRRCQSDGAEPYVLIYDVRRGPPS